MPSPFALILFCKFSRENRILNNNNNNNNNNVYLRLLLLLLLLLLLHSNIEAYIVSTRWNRPIIYIWDIVWHIPVYRARKIWHSSI